MDALGVVFGVFVGMLYCFLALVLFGPRPERDRQRPLGWAGCPNTGPTPRGGMPQARCLSRGCSSPPPTEELVVFRATYGAPGENPESSWRTREGAPRRTQPDAREAFEGDDLLARRGRYLDVVSR